MRVPDVRLILDGRPVEYGLADVAFHPTTLLIWRIQIGALDRGLIRDPGPHFKLNMSPNVILQAIEAGSIVARHTNGDLGEMYWYGGASARDGTSRRGISSLDISIDLPDDCPIMVMPVSGHLVDKEQTIVGSALPPKHKEFELSFAVPLGELSELFEFSPAEQCAISDALWRR